MREGRASSTRSKNSRSILVALREKIEKFAPPPARVAPIGMLRPVVGAANGALHSRLLLRSDHKLAVR